MLQKSRFTELQQHQLAPLAWNKSWFVDRRARCPRGPLPARPQLQHGARVIVAPLSPPGVPAASLATAVEHETRRTRTRWPTGPVAVPHLKLSLGPAPDTTSIDAGHVLDELVTFRRCGFSSAPDMTVQRLVQHLNVCCTENGRRTIDRTVCLLGIRNVQRFWLGPMRNFCATHEPAAGSLLQRDQVRALLARCGWAQEPEATALVLETLQWDTVEVLYFALELLRLHYDELWVPLAQQLTVEFSSAAVVPLRKLVDPELTLALVVAAPEQQQQQEENAVRQQCLNTK